MARERFEENTPNANGTTTSYNPAAYGGSNGTYDGAGNLISTPQSEAAKRNTDIGNQMQGRQGYQFDNAAVDQDRNQEDQSRLAQHNSSNTWRDQAMGTDKTSYNYGQSLIARGQQNQQAAALSASGGPLAQMSAASRANQGAAAYQQQGTNTLNAQQADDMAAGRAGWSTALGQQRTNDQTGQTIEDAGTAMTAEAAAKQRTLNDAGQATMDQNTIDSNKSASEAAANAQAEAQKLSDAKREQNQAKDDNVKKIMGTSGSIIGGAIGGPMGAAIGGGVVGGLGDLLSDERAKEKFGPNALMSLAHPDDPTVSINPDHGKPNKSDPPPSEYIAEDWRKTHVPSTEANTTPAMTGYDRNVFKSNDKNDDGIGTEALHAAIEKRATRDQAIEDARKDMAADMRGVGGARRGYAESRRGKAGDMFGGGPSGQGGWASSWDEDHKQAPGTRDYLKYGQDTKRFDARMNKPVTQMDKGDEYTHAVMTSDERTKKPAELTAAEKAKDEEDTRKFMEGSKPVEKATPEEDKDASDKQAYEAKEAERTARLADEAAERHAAAAWTDKNDAAVAQKVRGQRMVPEFLKNWAASRIENRRFAPEAEREQRAHGAADRELAYGAHRHDLDGLVPNAARPAIEKTKGPRQMKSFQRGDKDSLAYGETTSDEDTKDKIDYANPKEIKPLSNDADGTQRGWDRDDASVKTGDAHVNASLSGPVPKYSHRDVGTEGESRASTPAARSSAGAKAPGSRKMSMAELEKAGRELQGNVKTQSEALTRDPERLKREGEEMRSAQDESNRAQLEAGPAVQDRSDGGAKWLDDYMTSDEKTKSKGGNPLIDMQKDANRALRGETYKYKDGFGEDTNQVHHGFMAQNLEKNPITMTAVREGPDGIKKVNNEDALRVTAAGVASLQDQHDELEAAVDALAARRKKKAS